MLATYLAQEVVKMKREELIRRLRDAMKTEESAIAIYSRHLAAIVDKSGLPESTSSEIKRTLKGLIDANVKHKNLISGLLMRIEGESIDVF